MTEQTKKPVNKIRLSKAQIKEGLKQIPMEIILTGSGKKGTLTHKQKQFARNVALGKPKTEAYRDAYNSKGNGNTVGSEACKLAAVPKVAQEIEATRAAIEAMEYLKADRLKALVLHQLTQHALNEDFPPASRIRSLELLGKSAEVGLFIDRKEITTINTSNDAKSNLMDKIREAMKRNAIEVDYKDSGDSLLDELNSTPAPSENFTDEPHAPATPLNEPSDRGPAMHNSLHTQSPKNDPSQPIDSKGNNIWQPLPDNTNNINNEAQVIDSKENTPPPTKNVATTTWVEKETPPVNDSLKK